MLWVPLLTLIRLQVSTINIHALMYMLLGTGVASAIKESANTLNRIGMQHEEHGKKDMEQLLDWLYTYKGLLSNVPEILNVHKVSVCWMGLKCEEKGGFFGYFVFGTFFGSEGSVNL
jgi:hypothetical protein